MITSKQNKTFKKYVSLKLKKYRDQYDLFLVYGKHLVEQAQKKRVVVEVITSNPMIDGTLYDRSLLEDLQQTETYMDVIAVCRKENIKISSNRILMLDDVQDPDNVGALLRSAVAFGFNHIIFSPHCADLYNEKTIRASKGALFDVYVERKPLKSALIELKQMGYTVLGADAHEGGKIHPTNQIVLVLGNEGHGLSSEVIDEIDDFVHIDTKDVESLNVSVAGSILMYLWRNL
ncbi:MAG: RNA methyltransferase [Acholeplasmataceae bacterium]|jgi:TrmH family RNA methyltransferase|nr:RNA methyltransferase [Acholeplasmataceae bacterium]